jgi:hypothetical protein
VSSASYTYAAQNKSAAFETSIFEPIPRRVYIFPFLDFLTHLHRARQPFKLLVILAVHLLVPAVELGRYNTGVDWEVALEHLRWNPNRSGIDQASDTRLTIQGIISLNREARSESRIKGCRFKCLGHKSASRCIAINLEVECNATQKLAQERMTQRTIEGGSEITLKKSTVFGLMLPLRTSPSASIRALSDCLCDFASSK